MTSYKAVLTVVLASLATPSLGCAQGGAQTHSPTEIVSAIHASGSALAVWAEVGFQGCPQDDTRGRAVFERIAGESLPPMALRDLAIRWSVAYVDCDFSPLDSWYETALSQVIRSGDQTAAFQFLSALPPDIPATMRETLWEGVESDGFARGVVEAFASAAVRSTDAAAWVTRSIAAFRDRQVPTTWVQGESGVLLRQHGASFLREITRVGATLSDDRITEVAAVVTSGRARGLLDADAPGLDEFRGLVESRPGVPEHVREGLR